MRVFRYKIHLYEFLLGLIGLLIFGFFLCNPIPAFSQQPDTVHTNSITDLISHGLGKYSAIFGVSNYQKYDGTFEPVNTAIYTREERTAEGYKYGVWSNNIIAEFPDSSNGFVTSRLREGSVIRQKFTGVANLNKSTKQYQIISSPNTVAGVINGNKMTYPNIYNGVDLSYTVYDRQVKAELTVSESVRNNLNSPYPANETIVVLITEMEFENLSPKSKRDLSDAFQTDNMIVDSVSIGLYKGADEPLRLPFGWAFQESERSNPNRNSFRMKQAHVRKNGKNYALSGIPLNLVIDTINYPGAIVFDPTVTWQHGPSYGKDTFLDESQPEDNRGVRTDLFIQADAGFNRHILLEFDSITVVIPSNETVVGASLILTVDPGGGLLPDSLTSIYRVTRLWTEGTEVGLPGISNWDSSSTSADNGGPSDSAWVSAGGDYDGTKYSTRTLSGYSPGDTVIYGGNLKNLVQGWVDGTWNNDGMLIKFDTEDWGTAAREEFGSSDHATSANRAKLTVDFTKRAEIINLTFSDTTDTSFTVTWEPKLNFEAPFDSFGLFISDFPGNTSLLQLYIPMNRDAGDSSGHGRDGTNFGALLINDIDSTLGGGVYTFDLGVNDYINFGDILDIGTGDMSITAIVTPYTVTRGFIVSKAQNEYQVGYTFGFSEGGQIRASLKVTGGSTIVTGSTPNAGQKYVYAATWDRDDSLKIYVDGEFDAGKSITAHTANSNTTRQLRIGLNGLASFFPFHGTIDEVKIYKRVLTATEIRDYADEVRSPRRSAFTANTTVASADTFSPNTEYQFSIFGINEDTLRNFSAPAHLWTGPQIPVFDTLRGWTNNSVLIGPGIVPGTDTVLIAMYSETFNRWIDANGDTAATETWLKPADWGSVVFDELNTATWYPFKLIAKGDGNQIGEYSPEDSAWTFKPIDSLTVDYGDTTTLTVYFGGDSAVGSGPIGYVLINDGNSTVISDTLAFSTGIKTLVTHDTLGINRQYFIRVKKIENPDSASISALIDSGWTDAQIPSILDYITIDDSTLIIKIDIKNNPSYTLLSLRDYALVLAGSTAVYIDADSFSVPEVWRSYIELGSAVGDTTRYWPSGWIFRLQVRAKSDTTKPGGD